MGISDELANIRRALAAVQTSVDAIQDEVDDTPPPPQQGDLHLKAGDNLQAALDQIDGATIYLEADATWQGSYVLRKKATHYRITTEGAADQRGARVLSGAGLAKIGGANGPAFSTEPGAGDVEIDNIELLPSTDPGRFSTTVALGTGMEKDVMELARDVTLRRVYSVVDWAAGKRCRRFVRAECVNFALLDFYVGGYCHPTPDDAQGFLTTNSPGPFLIENGFLEATGENFLFGGGDPQIKQLVPGEAGTIIRRVHCYKPLAWKTALRGYVKCLGELKNAKNIEIDQCVFENCWVDAQPGRGFLLTVRNQDKSAPWSTVANVTVRNSIIKGCESDAIHILGVDDTVGLASVKASNLKFVNVQIEACPKALIVVRGCDGLAFDHCTFADIKGYTMSFDQLAYPTSGFTFTNNLMKSGKWGIHSPTKPLGKPTLDAYAPGWTWGVNACEKSTDPTSFIAFPTGTIQLPPNAIVYDPAKQRYTPLHPGADGKACGADLSTGFADPR